jgi:general secretion pathway protein C
VRAAGLLVLAAAGGLAWGGWSLWGALFAERPAPPPPVTIDDALAEVARSAEPAPVSPWPPVFDRYVPDPPAPAAAPQPRQSWRLVGLVAGGAEGWAILSGAAGEEIVRKGDMLGTGTQVLAIEEAGVRLLQDGEEVLVGFDKTPRSMLADLVSNASDAPLEAELPLSLLAGRDLRLVLGRAGSVRMVAPNGGQGELVPEILWVREGHLYDLIGLRKGDRVLRINGRAVFDPELLVNAKDMVASAEEVAIDILRAGQRRTIRVRISGRG